MAREEELERLMLDAQAAWLKGLDETVRQGIIAIDRLLAQRTDWIRQYSGKAAFRSDLRALHAAIGKAARDGSRWKRRLATEDRADHALGQAQMELAQLETDKGRAGLWSKREWAERRRKQTLRVENRRQVRDAARVATGPKAQVDYQRQSQASIQALKDLTKRMVEVYPLGPGAKEVADGAVAPVAAALGQDAPSAVVGPLMPPGRKPTLH
jgi:hypothetical protein